MVFQLALKEILRNKSRFIAISLVIALITTLVLFIAALAQGLSNANKEYLSKLDADLIVYQSHVQLSTSSSQISRSTENKIRRVDGVAQIGSIGLSSGIAVDPATGEEFKISLIGIEPGKVGMPPVLEGNTITLNRGNGVVVDRNFALKTHIRLGDEFQIKTLQGNDYKTHQLKVIGMTDGQQYLFQPSIFLPYLTWDQIRAKSTLTSDQNHEYTANIVAVQTATGVTLNDVIRRIETQVQDVEVADLNTAINAIPGYVVQQQTLGFMQIFTLLIGVLVIGGFFQIQMLQKIPQIGVLKAIGTSNATVAAASVIQILWVSTFGVLLGGLFTWLASLGLPATVPIVFSGPSVLIAVLALLLIGPLGGLVTVRLAVNVEPLTALGLSA